MLRFILLALFIFVPFDTPAQTVANYVPDLDTLYATLQKTPSFQEQITGQRLQDYQALYQRLKSDTLSLGTDYDVFYRLIQLLFPLKDNHLGFYQLPNSSLTKPKFTDSVAVAQYRTTKAFLDYPKIKINIDSLEAVLARKSNDSVEGIYYYDTYLKIGLFRNRPGNQLTGVVLSTTLPTWEKGQVAIRLYEYAPNYFRAVYGHPVYKTLALFSNEKFRNQSLVNAHFYGSVSENVYRKNPGAPNFTVIDKNTPVFQYKRLKKGIDYIRLGSFSAIPADMQTAQRFHEQIRDSLIAPHLIVDLRDNTGGAAKVEKPFFRLIQQYAKTGKVYVLINNGTMSQGEIATLRLKTLDGVTTYGEPTRGTITYGSNYDKIVKLPSGKYQVYPTDMRDQGHYLPYESVGVLPDSTLKNDSDWLTQLVTKIDNQP